jgi:hypothetical protein
VLSFTTGKDGFRKLTLVILMGAEGEKFKSLPGIFRISQTLAIKSVGTSGVDVINMFTVDIYKSLMSLKFSESKISNFS